MVQQNSPTKVWHSVKVDKVQCSVLHPVHGGQQGAAQSLVQCMASLGGPVIGGLQERKAGAQGAESTCFGSNLLSGLNLLNWPY